MTSAGVFLTSSVLRRGLRHMESLKVRERVGHGLSAVQDVDEAQAESCPAEWCGVSLSLTIAIVTRACRASRTAPGTGRLEPFLATELLGGEGPVVRRRPWRRPVDAPTSFAVRRAELSHLYGTALGGPTAAKLSDSPPSHGSWSLLSARSAMHPIRFDGTLLALFSIIRFYVLLV